MTRGYLTAVRWMQGIVTTIRSVDAMGRKKKETA